jgi:hypothetical protein
MTVLVPFKFTGKAEVNALGYNDITRFTTGTSVEILVLWG